MFKDIDWKGLLEAMLKAALPFFIGGAIGVTATGCSSLQTPRTKRKFKTSFVHLHLKPSPNRSILELKLKTPTHERATSAVIKARLQKVSLQTAEGPTLPHGRYCEAKSA